MTRRVAALRQDETHKSQLPPDLLADSARRLKIAALAMAIANGAAIPISLLVEGQHLRPELPHARLLWFLAVALSLTVYVLSDKNIGPTYEVLLCLLISLIEHLGPYREVSFVCVVIVLFPSLVPQRPLNTLKTSLLAAATGPVASLFHPVDLGDLALQTTFTVASALLAVAPSLVIFRLSKNLNAARELGAYRLETLLGKGGMGEVWKARHNLLARPAAVKLMRGESATLERFKREANATASLRSPHTVCLYDFGYTPEGTFYYAMEHLEGTDLEKLAKPLPKERVAQILKQVCLSLEEAHQQGLIHRDIKPANIFLTEHDHVKVLDFGLVATPDEKDAVFGTPDTMAPEQIRGEALTPQTDLYALGCVAYQLLTGRKPFDYPTVQMTLNAHLHENPAPIHHDLVMQCLAKNPQDRPASAREMREKL